MTSDDVLIERSIAGHRARIRQYRTPELAGPDEARWTITFAGTPILDAIEAQARVKGGHWGVSPVRVGLNTVMRVRAVLLEAGEGSDVDWASLGASEEVIAGFAGAQLADVVDLLESLFSTGGDYRSISVIAATVADALTRSVHRV